MRGPLTVSIDDGTGPRHVTGRTTGLRFKRSAFGGDVDVSCSIRLPAALTGDLGGGDSLRVMDGRTAGTVFAAHLDHPGQTAGPAGEGLEVQGFGAAARLQAATTPVAYVLVADDGWTRSANSTRGAKTSTGERGTSEMQTFNVAWDKGFDVDRFDSGEWVNRGLQAAGLQAGRVSVTLDAGTSAAGWVQRIMSGPAVDSLTSAAARDADTTLATLAATRGAGLAAGDDVIALRAVRSGAGVNADKNTWFQFWGPVIRQLLLDRHGAAVTTGYTTDTVKAHQVIEDMVGRGMAPGIDPAKVTLPATTYPIDALAALDGITFGDMMRELLTYEPDLYWMAADDRLRVGLFDDTNPRYVISRRDGGITKPGEEWGLCNRIAVSWVDRKGRDQVTIVTTTVDGLDWTQDAEPITLPRTMGSAANAQRAGTMRLAQVNRRARAGTAVVRRPIRDLWAGCVVWPHELQPGCAVLEQETGVTYRLTEVEYVDTDAAAAVTLNTPPLDEAQTLARLARRLRRRR